jgi:hypothetical protein
MGFLDASSKEIETEIKVAEKLRWQKIGIVCVCFLIALLFALFTDVRFGKANLSFLIIEVIASAIGFTLLPLLIGLVTKISQGKWQIAFLIVFCFQCLVVILFKAFR